MSWTNIRSYFNDRCEEQGLSEWEDAFNTDDIPSTVIDGSFHVQFKDFDGDGQNHRDQETTVNVEVQFFLKGFAKPRDAVDAVIIKAEAIVKSSIIETNRLTQDFKNVIFRSMSIEPFSDSNDNIARARMQFSIRSILQP